MTNGLSIFGLVIIIISVIAGSYLIPITAENDLKQKQQRCIDEYIFVVYDFMKREEMQKLALNIYMSEWMERCFDVDWGISKEEFFDRVEQLGYGDLIK